ncbi:MAG: tetratricopeptide repeat protein [Acidobacteria bacterium]|jgi:tetratricopeptide (TPR) repeat protein|nr:tetratricopeptide repeat protein [Acidobacteriota bacterium]
MENESQRHRLERCQQDVEDHPDRASSHYNLGLAYTVSGRVKQAEEAYLKALDIDPTMVQAWVNLGGVRLMRWEFQGCLEANQAAAKLRDDLPIVHYNMGQAYLYLNDPENLVRCNERVIALERDHAAAHYYAAVGHLAMNNLGAAERHLGRALELGHRPTQDFMKAMEKANLKKQRSQRISLIEISGAEAPEKTKED